MPIAGAIPLIAAGVGAAGSVAGGLIGAQGAQSAADTQVGFDQQALAAQQIAAAKGISIQDANTWLAEKIASQNQNKAIRADVVGQNIQSKQLAPYADIGLGAADQLANLYGISYAGRGNGAYSVGPRGVITRANSNDPNSSAGGPAAQQAAFTQFTNSPDYQFAFQQGLQALNRAGAASGTLQSGGQVKAATEFGQGLASQQYGNYFGRLNSLAQMGQTASTAIGNAGLVGGSNQANAYLTSAGLQSNILQSQGANAEAATLLGGASLAGNTLQNTGTAAASGIVGSANALSGGLTGAGSAISQSLLLSQLLNTNPSGYRPPAPAPTYGGS